MHAEDQTYGSMHARHSPAVAQLVANLRELIVLGLDRRAGARPSRNGDDLDDPNVMVASAAARTFTRSCLRVTHSTASRG